MRVNDDYKLGWNAASQIPDPDSVLSFWGKAVKMRKERKDVFVSPGLLSDWKFQWLATDPFRTF